ncbi:type II 3-dehydroquinate dehydratase [Glaciecola sp. MH2013]|uniref:type II 3-dehydroquinate dehydratase n=1 Tax=Glaciecola sp. MH2013 TaxID=2785524 RepID=UPI00189FA51F|nr:type II 3-dehydroquinate dehydratase [Glaciecola sp. MH2013]MBF7074333.1 type II 3-dehydroquinate dehydratase [Glaciecola sp. MH2013]
MNILVLNGPNLNLLGKREPEIYGRESLDEVMAGLVNYAAECGAEISHFQSNAEHELVNKIQSVLLDDSVYEGIIINPAAFTHSSIAIRDALLASALPVIEVHLSNIHKREAFRQHSFISDIASGVIVGLGTVGYRLALDALLDKK